MHTFHTADYGALSVADDYEQGLGDNVDCIGQPLTVGGAVLRRIDCQLTRSQLFRIILDPDIPFSVQAVTEDALRIQPELKVMSVCALSGVGMDRWCERGAL